MQSFDVFLNASLYKLFNKQCNCQWLHFTWPYSNSLTCFVSADRHMCMLFHRHALQWRHNERDGVSIHRLHIRYTPITQGLRPLCLPCATTKLDRSPLKAEGRPNGCLGRSMVAHRTFRHRHARHGRRKVLSMFKTVAQRSPRKSVAHRSLKGGKMKAHTSPWSQNGCTVVGHWSPSKKCEHFVSIWATRLPSLYHHCASFGRPMASIERSLWRPLCLHSATTATLESPWQWFCLHSAFFVRPVVPLQQLWSFKEGTRAVLQQLHRNRTFWVPATTERPNHFYGRTKVARRSQPCIKGTLG